MAIDADRPSSPDSSAQRITRLLTGKVRARSEAAIASAEAHLALSGDGVFILQMQDGLLDVTFLPGASQGTWKLVLESH
jgi:hypothetical protein